LLDVEAVALSATFGAHDHLTSVVLDAFESSWVLLEPEMPEFLLLLTLGVRVEDVDQILALFYLSISIGVHDLGEVLHETEVCSHGVRQTGYLAKLREKSNLSTGLSVLVDEKWLVGFFDVLVVASLVVLLVRDL
jgi:hypothetical protein